MVIRDLVGKGTDKKWRTVEDVMKHYQELYKRQFQELTAQVKAGGHGLRQPIKEVFKLLARKGQLHGR